MTVYLIINRQTDAVAIGRVFATPDAADWALAALASWVAPESVIRQTFVIHPVEVEGQQDRAGKENRSQCEAEILTDV